MTKKQNDDLSKTIKKDENGNAYVDNEAMDKVMEDTGIKGKVKNAIRKNEIQGLASAVAIGAGIGFTIGFAVSLAQSGITPDSVKYAFVNGGKSGVASGVQSVVGYGIGRTIGQVATNAIEGVLSNAGLEITANSFQNVHNGNGWSHYRCRILHGTICKAYLPWRMFEVCGHSSRVNRHSFSLSPFWRSRLLHRECGEAPQVLSYLLAQG